MNYTGAASQAECATAITKQAAEDATAMQRAEAGALMLAAAESVESQTGGKLVATYRVLDRAKFGWGTVLAGELIGNPALAGKSNRELAVLLSAKLNTATPIYHTRFSEQLAQKDAKAAREVLADGGYGSEGVETATDIKRAVKGGLKKSDLEFRPHGVRVRDSSGAMSLLRYKLREGTPCTGSAHLDFCVTLAGMDMPLMAFLKLHRVGINEFITRDGASFDSATWRGFGPDEAAKDFARAISIRERMDDSAVTIRVPLDFAKVTDAVIASAERHGGVMRDLHAELTAGRRSPCATVRAALIASGMPMVEALAALSKAGEVALTLNEPDDTEVLEAE